MLTSREYLPGPRGSGVAGIFMILASHSGIDLIHLHRQETCIQSHVLTHAHIKSLHQMKMQSMHNGEQSQIKAAMHGRRQG